MGVPPLDLAAENGLLRERVAQLERALDTHSDPILKALVENAPTYLNVITPEGRFMATGRTNASFGSVIGKSVFEFTEPHTHEATRSAWARAVATGEPVVYETVGYAENGETGHVYIVRAIPLRDGDQVTALMLVPTDITDRVRLENSLIESERKLRLAVEASRLGLWRWDVVTDQIEWDARTCEVFGVAEKPAGYDAYQKLLHPADLDLVRGVAERALETGVYPTFEHRLANAPGEPERWVLAAATVVQDCEGKSVSMMGGVLDISEQKHLAAQLARAERVESIGQLTAGIAHNFNNLLTAIVPNIELASLTVGDAERALLSAALDASLQARDLVSSLLALAGRRSGRPELQCDPRLVIERVESMCRMTFPREIEFTTRIADQLGNVRMAPTDLEQVMLNLLFNARDAVLARSGGPRRIDVLVERVSDAEGGKIQIQVRDTGVGMSELVQRRIFEPFFTTKSTQHGSGLGLSNALARVRDACGSLECQSLAGVGATFTLALPQAQCVVELASENATEVDAPGAARGETVLIVDDEAMVRTVVRRMLTRQGYVVLEASSAAEARSVLDREAARVQLIILDHSMPKESGLEALPMLRARCAAPVILFTGLAPEVPTEIAAVLRKPARPAELFQLVRSVLDGERAARVAT
jgi:PAS domain S-box-containing protein